MFCELLYLFKFKLKILKSTVLVIMYPNNVRSQLIPIIMPPIPVVLVGIMGSGKTSIGRRLSRRLELPFFDSDQEFEERSRYSIADYISTFGQEVFAQGEHKVIKSILEQESIHVLATGGSSLENHNTELLIKEKAISVWLNADLDTLVARVSRRNDRPQFATGDKRETLQQQIDKFYPIYQNANVHVKTLDEPTNVTVERVIKEMNEYIKAHYPNHKVMKSV